MDTKMTKLTLLIWCAFYYPTLIKNHFKLTMVFFMNRLTISLSWKYFSQFTRKKKSRNGLVVRVNTSKISGAYKTSHKHLSNVDQLISSNTVPMGDHAPQSSDSICFVENKYFSYTTNMPPFPFMYYLKS